jgi:hypothetical protein
MNVFDHPSALPALSAIGGSLVGALSSTISVWIAQRHQDRRVLVAQQSAQREQLFSSFIEESARLLVDAMQHSFDDPTKLIPVYAVLTRIRLNCSATVVASAERIVDIILKTYLEPNLSAEEIQIRANAHNDYLRDFSNICRGELDALWAGL